MSMVSVWLYYWCETFTGKKAVEALFIILMSTDKRDLYLRAIGCIGPDSRRLCF
jgi:hypothetical protein